MTTGTLETFGCFRMRAVGGRALDGARLFRSAELTDITEAEAGVLAERFGVRLICDVRSQWEIASNPEPAIGCFDYVATLPSFERRRKDSSSRLVAGIIGEYGAPEERMLRNYRRYVDGYPGIGRAIRAIATEGVPSLIHCVNGKDRTGVACAAMLKIAGAHHDDIMEDYLSANVVNRDRIEAEFEVLSVGMDDVEVRILRSFLEARPSYLNAYFSEIKTRYGSFERYVVEGLRLNAFQRESLAELLS